MKAKTALLEHTVVSMQTEMNAFKNQLDILNKKAESELPERVGSLLHINANENLEAKT